MYTSLARARCAAPTPARLPWTHAVHPPPSRQASGPPPCAHRARPHSPPNACALLVAKRAGSLRRRSRASPLPHTHTQARPSLGRSHTSRHRPRFTRTCSAPPGDTRRSLCTPSSPPSARPRARLTPARSSRAFQSADAERAPAACAMPPPRGAYAHAISAHAISPSAALPGRGRGSRPPEARGWAHVRAPP